MSLLSGEIQGEREREMVEREREREEVKGACEFFLPFFLSLVGKEVEQGWMYAPRLGLFGGVWEVEGNEKMDRRAHLTDSSTSPPSSFLVSLFRSSTSIEIPSLIADGEDEASLLEEEEGEEGSGTGNEARSTSTSTR